MAKHILAWDDNPHAFHASAAASEGRPHEVIHVNNVKVNALIDSGADICLMDAGYLDDMCPRPTLLDRHASCLDVRNRPLDVIGEFLVSILIRQRAVKFPVMMS